MNLTLTSATANKMIRKLNEEKQELINMERQRCTYRALQDEEPTIPKYMFEDVLLEISEIDTRVRKIKHALNVFNCTTEVPGFDMTIDEALVYMAQLSSDKSRLAYLKDKEPKSRLGVSRLSNTNVPEFEYANYDIKLAVDSYKDTTEELIQLQTALDTINQTVTFEVH